MVLVESLAVSWLSADWLLIVGSWLMDVFGWFVSGWLFCWRVCCLLMYRVPGW